MGYWCVPCSQWPREKQTTGSKGCSSVPASTRTRKVQKPTVLKKTKKIQKARRSVKASARNAEQDTTEKEHLTGLEKLFRNLPEQLHGGLMKWGRDNGMESFDSRMEADAQKKMLAG